METSIPAEPTPGERQLCHDYLTSTRDKLVEATSMLSPEQFAFKPAPSQWSIAEVLEHLAVLESMVVANRLPQLCDALPGAPDRDYRLIDANIVKNTPVRSAVFPAPEILHPTGRWSPGESLKALIAARAQTITFLETTPGLRQHVMAHPAAGPLDAYQWVLIIAAHTDRHLNQIQEIKTNPAFPG